MFVESAIEHTAVPDKLDHFVRQQARWGRSFFRESAWVLTNFRPNRAAWWLTALEVVKWAVFSLRSRVVTFAVAPIYGYLNLLVMLALRSSHSAWRLGVRAPPSK